MKIKDFIDKVENLYLGCSMETRVCCDYFYTIPQWIGVERYTFKDENGEDVILKRNSDNSYHTDSVYFNVMACFDMLDDEFDSYYHSLSNMMNYLRKSLGDGEMCEDDELYIIYGQSVGDDNLYEITDISYSSDRMGDYIYISTRRIDVKDAVRNIKSEQRRKKWLEENSLIGN